MSDWAPEQPWIENKDFATIILDKIDLLDIINKYDIEYSKAAAGAFSYRLRCPFPEHLSGNERTASLYISNDLKSFHCFGCNNTGRIIEFIIRYKCVPYVRALEILYEDFSVDLNGSVIKKQRHRPKETIDYWMYKSSIVIREFMKNVSSNQGKWDAWAKRQYKRMDTVLDFPRNDWPRAKKYYERLTKFLESK